MGRPRPMNGTVGVTKPKAKAMKAALEAGETEKVMAFLNEAVAICESGEYAVIADESEKVEE